MELVAADPFAGGLHEPSESVRLLLQLLEEAKLLLEILVLLSCFFVDRGVGSCLHVKVSAVIAIGARLLLLGLHLLEAPLSKVSLAFTKFE